MKSIKIFLFFFLLIFLTRSTHILFKEFIIISKAKSQISHLIYSLKFYNFNENLDQNTKILSIYSQILLIFKNLIKRISTINIKNIFQNNIIQIEEGLHIIKISNNKLIDKNNIHENQLKISSNKLKTSFKLNKKLKLNPISSKISKLSKINLKSQTAKSKKKISKSIKLISSCISGIISTLQGPFCWKSSFDFGSIPTLCAPNLERILALCFEKCSPNYVHVLGVCWEMCPEDMTDIGAFCTKTEEYAWIYYPVFHVKSSYIPSSYTNFEDESICDSGMYKSGALCYRDCIKINYVNCGIDACASDNLSCAKGVIEIIVQVFVDILSWIGKFISKGIKILGKTNNYLEKILKTIDRERSISANNAVINLLFYMKNNFERFIKIIVKNSLKYLNFLVGDWIITNICKSVFEFSFDYSINNQNLDYKFFKNVNELPDCNDYDEIMCVKQLIEEYEIFDPTGILNLAAAFIHTDCIDV